MSGPYRIYWTYADPLLPTFANVSGTVFAPLYDKALERATAPLALYVPQPGEAPDLVRREIRARINVQVDQDVRYNTVQTGYMVYRFDRGHG